MAGANARHFLNNLMRYREIILEAQHESVHVYHGSPYGDIHEFRFDNLRQRTGTPGTLSFTTSKETALIYGPHIYEVEVQGTFGDYRDPEDVEKNFAWRWPARKKWLTAQYPPEKLEAGLKGAAVKDRREIEQGQYASWENVGLWRAMGWDGAWCVESGSRNLIVGRTAAIRLVGKVNDH